MSAKTIMVTGISGSGSRAFCSDYLTKNKKAKVYHTGDMLYEFAQKYSSTPIPRENLLNLQPDMLANLRDRTFEDLVHNLEKDSKKYDTLFIDTHGQCL